MAPSPSKRTQFLIAEVLKRLHRVVRGSSNDR